jgi:hypothetical protein
MKREVRLLLSKAVDSLTLSVEVFNRPYDRGRQTAVLIFLDHAFEMLLKAAILHRNGRIRERRAKQTIGFDACIRVGLSNGTARFLSHEQALLLQSINGLRDAAQHHILDVSEGQLYMQAQSGLTLFRDLLQSVFSRNLAIELPERVLPLATHAPTDLQMLFETEVEEIRALLRPGLRRQTEAMARLRPLAILDSAMRGEKGQPGRGELLKMKRDVASRRPWTEIFPGVAFVQITTEGAGPKVELRLTKKEGTPVYLVPEGTPGASVVAVKRVDELGFYNLGLKQLAEHVELSMPKALAVVKELRLQDEPECFKAFRIGKMTLKRYSQKAIERINNAMPRLDMARVWEAHKPPGKRKRT